MLLNWCKNMSMENKKMRVNYCDFLRLISITSVILIHVLADFRDFYLVHDKKYYFLLTFLDSITRTGVPIFFMLTGFFMLNSKKNESYSLFLKKRLPKLIIPFVLISLLYYIYESHKIGKDISIMDFFNLFTQNKIKYHFWFMYDIILIYLIIPFLNKLVNSLKREELKSLIILIYLSNILCIVKLLSNLFNLDLLGSFIYPQLIIYINYLFVGYYLRNYDISQNKKKHIYIFSIISLIMMPIVDFILTGNLRNDSALVASSPFSFIMSIGLFIFIKDNYDKIRFNSKAEKILSYTSEIIFYIYMMHVIIMELIKRILIKFISINSFRSSCLLIFLLFIFTFFISYIVSMIINLVYKKFETFLKKNKNYIFKYPFLNP